MEEAQVCGGPAYLCGGPAVNAASSTGGKEPVGQPEEAGLGPEHRRGHIQAEGHAVVAPCGATRACHLNPLISCNCGDYLSTVNI